MAAYGLDVECPHIFDGTHFAQWRNWMTYNIFCEIMDMKFAHEIWIFLNEKYGMISKEDVVPNVESHEDVEHDHNTMVVEDCSTSWSSEEDDDHSTRSLDKDDDDATSDANDDATSCTLDDEDDGYESDASTSSSTTSPHCFMSHGDTKVSIGDVIIDCDGPNFELTTCEQQKHLLYVTTCSHEELKLVHEELCVAHDNLVKDHALLTMKLSNEETKTNICSTSMSCETNLLKENNELKNVVNNLNNKLERCYNSKVTFEHILKTQRNYGDKCGLGFKKKMTKGKRKQEREKLSHFMCYRCHEMGHLANGCPNKEKLKKIKEEERLKHVKCFKCRTWGHLTSMCPTKQLVKQQEEPQPKPQVEQEKKPQAQVKFNHHGDLMMKKKKTRRGVRARHPIQIQDAKMMSKNDGHFASKCPTKLEKKAQATFKRQGNEKQHMSKEEKAQSKRSCYLCRERGHMAHSCPLGNNSKPILIDDNTMLRKDGNGTSMVAIAKHPATHTKAMPKYVAPNLRGPKLVWVPSKSG
ncbi:hypothetical protein SORBI_3005G120301 [Sorghum bicolor]|uniref:CCHC-type domain-containing protein n=1 Tax=Sorghum bicolor TaxID=4558 RepID=A0A1Z5RI76_SORBI|nr:hypothetical protein SORBI_3005G120301 [Sorghum bicolor]